MRGGDHGARRKVQLAGLVETTVGIRRALQQCHIAQAARLSIGDVAKMSIETDEAKLLCISRVNGNPSLTLQVIPSQGANVVDISHGVNAERDRLAPIVKAEFVTIFDQAPYIEQSIHDLSVEGGLGLLFAVLVILAFLRSWRSTVIAAVSIPLSAFVAANPKVDLSLVNFRFVIADRFSFTGKPLNYTGAPTLSIDDLHWSR